MSDKHRLRKTRKGTVINLSSKKQESDLGGSLEHVITDLEKNYSVKLTHLAEWKLKDIVSMLRKIFPKIEFYHFFDNTSLRPDGGILFIESKKGERYPILIAEAKNQGTNDLRAEEGLAKQAKGNAVERLGKNVIGFRTAMASESIFPFVCFGYGCDFDHESTILDRIVTIAMFGELNRTYLHNEGDKAVFNRGSFYFRKNKWSSAEMTRIMYDIAERSLLYYFSVYGKENFLL